MKHSRTHRLGPFWLVPHALHATASGRWSAVVLSWNIRQVELLPCLLLGRLTRTPVVLWGHGLGRSGSRHSMFARAIQARLATAIIVYSDGGAAQVRRIARRANVVVAQNTTGRPPPTVEDEIGELTHFVGYVGRLERRKQLDRLLDAVAELRCRGLPLRLSLLGQGPDGERLERHAESCGIRDVVDFRAANQDWNQVKAFLQGLDVVVFPEAGGLGVVDAFAAARGAVVLDSETVNGPEAANVVHRQTGVRYALPNARSLGDALGMLYGQPGLLAFCSQGAAQLYRDSLTMDRAVDSFLSVISPLLEENLDDPLQ